MPGVAPSFSVANINPGVVRTEFMRSVMALVERQRERERSLPWPRLQFDRFVDRISGPYLDDERNRCVEWFLESTTSDFLVFCDSDVAPQPDDFYRLVETAHDHGLVHLSGVYFNAYPEGLCPVVYRWLESDDDRVLSPISADELAKLDSDVPAAVDSTGAGFLCLSRSLLAEMGGYWPHSTPWFAEPVAGGTHYGEDHGLSLRIAHMGYSPHVLPCLVVAHHKTCVLRPPPATPEE